MNFQRLYIYHKKVRSSLLSARDFEFKLGKLPDIFHFFLNLNFLI